MSNAWANQSSPKLLIVGKEDNKMNEAFIAANKKIRFEDGFWTTTQGETYKSRTLCLLKQAKIERERLRAL